MAIATKDEAAVEAEARPQRRTDKLMRQLAYGRMAFGAATLLFPGLSARVMGLTGGANGRDGVRDTLFRLVGGRDLAIGAAYLLAHGQNRRTVVRIGVAVDALDAFTGARSRGRLPLPVAAGLTALGAGATAIGLAAVAEDVVGR